MYAQKYMIQLASGLEYLLQHKIIHRDLKPQNILITETYDLKITDFGFARYFDSDTMVETLCGTPLYMAPEIMKYKNPLLKEPIDTTVFNVNVVFSAACLAHCDIVTIIIYIYIYIYNFLL